jgi:hypothetical protein
VHIRKIAHDDEIKEEICDIDVNVRDNARIGMASILLHLFHGQHNPVAYIRLGDL